MNKFIFVVQTRDGQIHIGTCKAPGGSDARQKIKDHFGDNLVSLDFKGITSDSFMDHLVQCSLKSNRDQPTLHYHGDRTDVLERTDCGTDEGLPAYE